MQPARSFAKGKAAAVPAKGKAAAVPSMGDHKLQLNGVAGRMAHRMLNATYQTGADLKDTNAFLAEVQTHLKASADLKGALMAKELTHKEKSTLMEDILFKGMTNKNLVGRAMLTKMVEDADFEKHFDEVCSDYDRLVYAELGIVPAEVVSAIPLSKQQSKQIKTKLITLISKGQTVEVTESVDTNILGGLVVRLGDRAQDLSVASRLSQLEIGIRAIA